MKKVFVNGIILDGTKDMLPIEGRKIYVNNDIIEKISDEEPVGDYKVMDLKGCYVMPGLINLHVHLPASGRPKDKPSDPVKAVKLIRSSALMRKIGRDLCASYAKTELLSGVTTIRTVGGVADFDTRVRDDINRGKRVGSRILASNMAVSVPEGHMVDSLAYRATSIDDMVKYIDEIAKDKPDLIKLMITGGVLDAKKEGEPGQLKMPPEYVKAGCECAHKHRLKVAAHVESPEGVRVALENGVDTIEHGASPDDYIIRLFKEKNAALVTTLSPALPYAVFDQSVSHITDMEKVNGGIVFNGIIDCARACLDNGIPVGLGTDTGCPYTTHYNMWRELVYFHNYCKVPNAQCLYTATLGNAEIADIDDVTGSIEPGKSADFIVTKNNPLDNLENLRNLEMVVMRGKEIVKPKVRKMKLVEEQLDYILHTTEIKGETDGR